MALVLALDFGGTKLSAAATRLPFTSPPQWLARRRVYTPESADGLFEYATMLAMARELVVEVGPPDVIGVSFGGPADVTQGVVRLSHHVAGWDNVPLADWLEDEFGVPVVVDNDANAAALGEHRLGAGRGLDDLFYVTVSTGVGGGWVLNGEVHRGRGRMAGEIGHVVVNPGGMACVCGKQGCVEAEACGPAIAKRMQMLVEEYPEWGRPFVEWVGKQGNGQLSIVNGQWSMKITAQEVNAAAHDNIFLARQVLTEAGSFLGQGLGAVCNLMNPQRIILGGGVTKSGPLWWEAVRNTARTHALPEVDVEIVPAELGDDAPLWGAVVLANERVVPLSTSP
ncbi:MAG: ROK family protein [Chloroflexi bacterium]|nr:ROK family protein [Chloroflexota bacterium]MBP8055419.1 ROK family protein [Chloroflexota bacterium]